MTVAPAIAAEPDAARTSVVALPSCGPADARAPHELGALGALSTSGIGDAHGARRSLRARRVRRVATAPLRAALTVVFVTAIVSGSILQGIGYVSSRAVDALDREPATPTS